MKGDQMHSIRRFRSGSKYDSDAENALLLIWDGSPEAYSSIWLSDRLYLRR